MLSNLPKVMHPKSVAETGDSSHYLSPISLSYSLEIHFHLFILTTVFTVEKIVIHKNS